MVGSRRHQPREPPPERMRRIGTALVAVPTLLYVILGAPAWMFLAVALLAALIGFWELSRMLSRVDCPPFDLVGYLGVAALVISFYPGGLSPAMSTLALLLGACVAALTRPISRHTVLALAATLFACLYVGMFVGSLVGIRVATADSEGSFWLIFLLAVVMVGDAGAFYTGRLFGRHKLAPRMSPKKTVEGLLGGLVFSALAAWAVQYLWLGTVSVSSAVLLGVVLSLLGVLGDLFESMLKRAAGVKDSSALLPGHGGILDRLDSVLFSAPVLFIYLSFPPI